MMPSSKDAYRLQLHAAVAAAVEAAAAAAAEAAL